MRKIIAKTVILLLVMATFMAVTPVLAANETTFSEDTTITLTISSSSVDFTILANSVVDQIQVDTGSITFTISAGSHFRFRSNNRRNMTRSTSLYEGSYTCESSYSQYTFDTAPSTFAAGTTLTITPLATTCDNSTSGTSGSPSGSSPGSLSTEPTETPAKTPAETPATTETPAETIPPTPGVPATDSQGKVTLEQMTTDAGTVASGDVNQVISEMGVARNSASEAGYNESIVAKVVAGSGITAQVRNTIVNFVTYGTKSTKTLGAGERGGVVNSYQAAFGKLPTNTSEWNDVIKIANGRWPSETSASAESTATNTFKKIYLRNPDRTNPNDDAAVTVMSYGLRPADRNLDSEKAGIKIFKNIYGYNPTSATDWDAVRAIAYSGATR
ncbi:MAG: hypothetical protein ABIG60_00010 [Patescibacteria group bacterium]